jgi:NADH:ubiquinone oxidoreductase subunit 6 (subunit J)
MNAVVGARRPPIPIITCCFVFDRQSYFCIMGVVECFIFLLTVFAGLNIFLSKNPVVSIFLFIFIILNMSCFLLYLNVDFFAFILLMIYVGAIMILFTFLVMLLNIKIYERHTYLIRYVPATFIISIALVVGFSVMTLSRSHNVALLDDYINGFGYINWALQLDHIDMLSVVGFLLFTYY